MMRWAMLIDWSHCWIVFTVFFYKKFWCPSYLLINIAALLVGLVHPWHTHWQTIILFLFLYGFCLKWHVVRQLRMTLDRSCVYRNQIKNVLCHMELFSKSRTRGVLGVQPRLQPKPTLEILNFLKIAFSTSNSFFFSFCKCLQVVKCQHVVICYFCRVSNPPWLKAKQAVTRNFSQPSQLE